MTRAALASASVVLLLAGIAAGPGSARTRLAITVYPNGVGEPGAVRYSLGCGPAAGTVPHPAAACALLARLERPFAPVPPGTVCTDLALGPQEATVDGRLRGARLHAHLTVRGGCEIERWRRLAVVVPGFPGR